MKKQLTMNLGLDGGIIDHIGLMIPFNNRHEYTVAVHKPGSYKYLIVRSGMDKTEAEAFALVHGAAVVKPWRMSATPNIFLLVLKEMMAQVSSIPVAYFGK